MRMHDLLFWLKILQKILVPGSAVARKIEFFCMTLMKYLTVHNKEEKSVILEFTNLQLYDTGLNN